MFDIAFVHPPASLKKLTHPLCGVPGAQVASSDMLEHEPAGMIALASQLRGAGLRATVLNAGRLLSRLRSQGAGVEQLDAFFDEHAARIWAVGLHWAAHAPGALELARRLKRRHPRSIVLLGGISASYFHRQILRQHPEVDLVVLGEVEGLMAGIVEGLLAGHRALPNVVHLEGGQLVYGPRRPPLLEQLDYVGPAGLIRPAAPPGRRNVFVPLLHGCKRRCSFCGGGRTFYREHFCRDQLGVTPTAEVQQNLQRAAREGAAAVWLMGDARDAGEDYWRELTARLARSPSALDLYLELFEPASREYLESWRAVTTGRLLVAFSPESADEQVRRRLGRGGRYDNQDIADQLELAQKLGITLSLGFTFPLPGQDLASVRRTQQFIEQLCEAHGRLVSYMFEPLLLLDPGSPIFEDPEAHGYRLDLLGANNHQGQRSLAELVRCLGRPHWSFCLTYATAWMSRPQIFEALLQVGRARNRLLTRHQGASGARWFHHRLLQQHQRLLSRLQQLPPEATDEQLQQLVQQTLDPLFCQQNFSLVAPELEYEELDQTPVAADLFCRTSRLICRHTVGRVGPEPLLLAFADAGLLEPDRRLVQHQLLLLATLEQGRPEALERRPPSSMLRHYQALLEQLRLQLEAAMLGELLLHDWAHHCMELYARHHLATVDGARPQNLTTALLLLPPPVAYLRQQYDHRQILELERQTRLAPRPGQLVLSHHGQAVPLDDEEFELLRDCGTRIPFLELYGEALALTPDPTAWLQRLISCGVAIPLCA